MNDNASHAGSDAGRQRVRRNYMINPSFQWKYAINSAIMTFCLSTLVGIVLYGVLHSQARMRAASPESFSGEVTMIIFGFGLAFAALTAGAVGFWCLRVFHRIAGPLHVLEQYLGELAAGRFPRVRRLRTKDEFKGLHACFARTVNELKASRQQDHDQCTEALEAIRSAVDDADPAVKASLESAARNLEAACTNLASGLHESQDCSKAPGAPHASPAATSACLNVNLGGPSAGVQGQAADNSGMPGSANHRGN